MKMHTEERNGLFYVKVSRGEFGQVVYTASAQARDEKEAKAEAIARLNRKTRGIYDPLNFIG